MQVLDPYTAEAPEDIPNAKSDHSKLVFSSWPWAVGNIIFCSRFLFQTNRPPIGPLEFRPRANQYFMLSSAYQLVQKKTKHRTIHVFLLGVSISGQQTVSDLQNSKQTLFSISSLLGFILQRLCQTSTPAPTCAGIKYPVRGNPSLWYVHMYIYIYIYRALNPN